MMVRVVYFGGQHLSCQPLDSMALPEVLEDVQTSPRVIYSQTKFHLLLQMTNEKRRGRMVSDHINDGRHLWEKEVHLAPKGVR